VKIATLEYIRQFDWNDILNGQRVRLPIAQFIEDGDAGGFEEHLKMQVFTYTQRLMNIMQHRSEEYGHY
jgi:hypothetical protein